MKQRQKLNTRPVTRMSQQAKLIIGVGAGMLIGATMATVALRVDFSKDQAAEPATQEEFAPAADPQRRPPAVMQGGTLRAVPDDSLDRLSPERPASLK